MGTKVCGVALASLFYEHSRLTGHQEGFLLGKITTTKKYTVSDHAESTMTLQKVISVLHYIPVESPQTLFDNSICLDMKKLEMLMTPEQCKDIIGWYRCSHNVTLSPTMREHAIHRQLVKLFPAGADMHLLLCGTFGWATSPRHKFSHVFFAGSGKFLKSVDVMVRNLGETAHDNYKSSNAAEKRPEAFASAAITVARKFVDEHGKIKLVDHIQALATKMDTSLETLFKELSVTEENLAEERLELQALKDSINAHHLQFGHTLPINEALAIAKPVGVQKLSPLELVLATKNSMPLPNVNVKIPQVTPLYFPIIDPYRDGKAGLEITTREAVSEPVASTSAQAAQTQQNVQMMAPAKVTKVVNSHAPQFITVRRSVPAKAKDGQEVPLTSEQPECSHDGSSHHAASSHLGSGIESARKSTSPPRKRTLSTEEQGKNFAVQVEKQVEDLISFDDDLEENEPPNDDDEVMKEEPTSSAALGRRKAMRGRVDRENSAAQKPSGSPSL